MTSPTPTPRAARIAISAMFFFNGMGFASWVTRIPAVRHALRLSEGQLGMALFALAVGASAGGLLVGQGVSQQGHLTMVGALLLAGVLIVRRYLPPSTVHDEVAGPKFALPSAAMAAMGYSGFLVGPAFIGFVAQTTSLRLALGLLAVMAGVIAVLAYHLRGEPAAA